PGYYDRWVVTERERLGQVYLEVLNHLSALLEEAGEYGRALDYTRLAIVCNPLHEEAHCAAVRLYMALGRRLEAVRQYREMELLLREELGAVPSSRAQELWEQINVGSDVPRVMSEASDKCPATSLTLEPVGGAVPLDSGFYVVRSCDADFEAAIARQDSILLVKGPRQVGKTSLLARGLQRARRFGTYVVSTDLQKLNQEQLSSANAFYLASAQAMADQLNLRIGPEETWDARRGANGNFERYLRREVLEKLNAPLVWSLDEVDRLFPHDFSSEIFSLFRSWHNERALDPSGPWARLTIVIAYATEAHLFIRDLNQSPFNVGTRLTLEDFTLTQVAELNRRYNAPLRNSEEVIRYFHLVGGNPYLVQRGLYEMVTRGLDLSAFEKEAGRVGGPFHDHLQRVLTFLAQDVELREAVQNILCGTPCSSIHSFFRLRSAGIITGESPTKARLRCGLYYKYLEGQLA
ncbi:MAG TPA: AAA-like domain-containing protein, partial [Chthonomonadales bacterium]|nr:AAA-like domain-containing protein [Chthonomonadales bacterium]